MGSFSQRLSPSQPSHLPLLPLGPTWADITLHEWRSLAILSIRRRTAPLLRPIQTLVTLSAVLMSTSVRRLLLLDMHTDVRAHSLGRVDLPGLTVMYAQGALVTGVPTRGAAISLPRHTPTVRARQERLCRTRLGLAPSWRLGLHVCTRRHGRNLS